MVSSVSLESVCLSFGQIEALSELSFEVPEGEITALLGPNGAGKTTAIRLITGALTPSSGQITVLGRNPAGTGEAGEFVRSSCGVVSAKPSLYDRLSGYDNLLYAADLYGVSKTADTATKICDAAAQFGIVDALSQRVGGYSTGMRTRLALARSILHEPELLLLDEPTSGLDPESAQSVLELIRSMTNNGQTVLMCTHLLAEAEGLADEIVVIEAGTSLLAGKPDTLARRYWPDTEVRFGATNGATLDFLKHDSAVKRYVRKDNVAVLTIDSPEAIPRLVSEAVSNGASLNAVEPFKPSLEDLYFAIRKGSVPSTTGTLATVAPPPTGAQL